MSTRARLVLHPGRTFAMLWAGLTALGHAAKPPRHYATRSCTAEAWVKQVGFAQWSRATRLLSAQLPKGYCKAFLISEIA
jgi:hypothetical protein